MFDGLGWVTEELIVHCMVNLLVLVGFYFGYEIAKEKNEKNEISLRQRIVITLMVGIIWSTLLIPVSVFVITCEKTLESGLEFFSAYYLLLIESIGF